MNATHVLPTKDELELGIEAVLRKATGSPQRQPASTLPPASPNGGPGPEMWGPSTTHATSPLQLLVQVADNTVRLQEQMEALCREVTGEQAPPKRLQPMPLKAGGLLPAIAQVATNIEQAHVELERLILHVRRRL